MARMKRLYAPYVQVGKRWYRATWTAKVETSEGIKEEEREYVALFKENAIRRYQNWLLAPLLGNVPYEKRELRPIPLNSKEYDNYNF